MFRNMYIKYVKKLEVKQKKQTMLLFCQSLLSRDEPSFLYEQFVCSYQH